MSTDIAERESAADAATDRPTIYFDGLTNRRHVVELCLGSTLDLIEDGAVVASWAYDDLRAGDGVRGMLRLKCTTGLPLARLEVFDLPTQAEIRGRAGSLDKDRGGGHAHTGRIVAWSLAAIVSIFLVVVYGRSLPSD